MLLHFIPVLLGDVQSETLICDISSWEQSPHHGATQRNWFILAGLSWLYGPWKREAPNQHMHGSMNPQRCQCGLTEIIWKRNTQPPAINMLPTVSPDPSNIPKNKTWILMAHVSIFCCRQRTTHLTETIQCYTEKAVTWGCQDRPPACLWGITHNGWEYHLLGLSPPHNKHWSAEDDKAFHLKI